MWACPEFNLVILERCMLCTPWNVTMVESRSDAHDLLHHSFAERKAIVEGFSGSRSSTKYLEDCI